MNNSLYVGNLHADTTSAELKALFSEAGAVVSAKVITDRDTRESRGFGFVEMADAAGAQQAIARLNGYVLNDRPMLVRAANPPGARGEGGKGGREGNRPKFREIRHKARGGRKARSY
jgi:RNA recognition motif-containing protein